MLISVAMAKTEPAGASFTFLHICDVEPLKSLPAMTSSVHSGWDMM